MRIVGVSDWRARDDLVQLSCGHAAGCMAEELLAAHVVMQCSYDLQHAEEWAHLTDDERSRAVRALDGVFDLFQDDEAVSLWGDVTAELTTPEDALREVGEWFRPFGGVHPTGHLDPD